MEKNNETLKRPIALANLLLELSKKKKKEERRQRKRKREDSNIGKERQDFTHLTGIKKIIQIMQNLCQ